MVVRATSLPQWQAGGGLNQHPRRSSGRKPQKARFSPLIGIALGGKDTMPDYDFFISHASADKANYIEPLAKALSRKGLTFWLDSLEVGWGDNLALKLSEGLHNSRFVLLCLSRNFLQRPWPENELGAALAIQSSSGAKRVLPLILDSKDQVLSRYAILSGLAYREFEDGVERLTDELASLCHRSEQEKEGWLHITVESVHTAQICPLLVEPRVSVRWLSDKAQSELGVSSSAKAGAYAPFSVRWILVDARAEDIWQTLGRDEQRRLYALVYSDRGLRFCHSDRERLEDIGIYDGIVFHLYAIEDEEFHPPPAKYGF
jgi:TIR domain